MRQAITQLSLTGFRTYESASIALEPLPVVLVGPNGIGKTNVLEAISFLGSGRGLRGASLAEPCRQAASPTQQPRASQTSQGISPSPPIVAQSGPLPMAWAVSARLLVDGAEGPQIGVGLDPVGRSKRIVRINSAPAPSALAVTEYFSLSWLTPAMDGLFTGSLSNRRRFFDRLVLALNPAHASAVNAYELAMRNRNRLLSQDSAPDPSWLSAIEDQMAEHGVAVAAGRRELLAQLTRAIAGEPESLFPAADLALLGAAEDALGTSSAAQVEMLLKDIWAAERARDAAAGRTLSGPHRTDLSVRHAPKDQPAHLCSTGEQKALLLGLILAHARMVETLTGRGPILLLDEVAAHLDEGRRAALFERLLTHDGQAWMTGTDLALFSAMRPAAQTLRISDGAIARITEKD